MNKIWDLDNFKHCMIEKDKKLNTSALPIGHADDAKVYSTVPSDFAKSLKVATKFDEGKRDWSLLPLDSVEEIVKVLEFGANKYAAHNWSSNGGFKYTRVINAMIRHLFAFARGVDKDPETGLSHLAHLGCNVLFLLHFVANKDKFRDNDDRNIS
jgi:hypothetical protein